MATNKKRVPVTIPPDIEATLNDFSKEHGLSLSQTIALLARYGLERAEDEYFGQLADELDEKTTGYVSHEEFWNKVLPS